MTAQERLAFSELQDRFDKLLAAYRWGGILQGAGRMSGQSAEEHAEDLKTLIEAMAHRISVLEAKCSLRPSA